MISVNSHTTGTALGQDCNGSTTLHGLDVDDLEPKLHVKHIESDDTDWLRFWKIEYHGNPIIEAGIGEVKASNKGNCCWEYYRWPRFGARFQNKPQILSQGTHKLNLGETGILLPFKPRSVRIVKC